MSTSSESNDPGPRYPGVPHALDGTNAVVYSETSGGEAAGAYPITPSSAMGEGWALAVSRGDTNVFGRRLIFFEPEGEHAAAGVTAGLSMSGLRAANFSAAQGIAYMHESLYAAVGKRLTYVLNIACRAMTKQSLNIHCAHDDYHAADDTGFIQFFAKDVQSVGDINLIAHRTAELALTPAICAMDGFLTSHVIETLNLPEKELVREYLGDPADIIDTPTPGQRLMFGDTRRRIPALFDYDDPAQLGTVQNQDSYAQGVAAQRPYFFDHVRELAEQAMAEFEALTGRHYARAMGYRTDDAEYLLVAQGSLVSNAEAVADYLRETRNIKIGVIDMVMFRPFPDDLVLELIRGKRGVTILERVDQPLAEDLPMMREFRAALTKGLENGRASADAPPYPGLPALRPSEAPLFFSGSAGLGSRDLQPGDIIAAVDNMLPGGKRQRFFYLGVEFVRDNAVLGLKRLQDRIVAAYPNVKDLALARKGDVHIEAKGSLATRIHSIGGWGAITMGKNITKMLFDLLGLHVKSNPKYGSEKKGMPTTFFAVFAHDKIRLNCDLKHVDVVLSPDANVFGHSNPLAGLAEGGVFIIQSDRPPEEVWTHLPRKAQQTIIDKKLNVFCIDGFKIAREEASNVELQFRMQGNAFMGAFFRTSPLMQREGLAEGTLFEGIRKTLHKTFGGKGARVVDDNFRVIRRGYEEVLKVEPGALSDETTKRVGVPWYLSPSGSSGGIGDVERFFEETSLTYLEGDEPIADPFVALSAVPAATGAFRDMTAIRFHVPEFVPGNCTGCGECWSQCPDTAIPGLVSELEDVIRTAMNATKDGAPLRELPAIVATLAVDARKTLKEGEFTTFAATLAAAYEKTTSRMGLSAERRLTLDKEFSPVLGRLRDFPLTKVTPFFDAPEAREGGSGGLLSITINPNTCKGCMLCVAACNDNALRPIVQDDEVIAKLRRNWDLWQRLPDTPQRFISVTDIDQGIGALHQLLLKKDAYHAMVGGDGACMGCGEKTVLHLVLAAVEASLQPRVAKFVKKLDRLIADLDSKARLLVTAGADLSALAGGEGKVDVKLDDATRLQLSQINELLAQLKDLKWRYEEGPSGRGRASLGMTNSTGCSSVWGGTFPYNPYPYPWTNHLFQDAPSIAIGLFEGHMRKMADGFAAVRRAEAHIAGTWNRAADQRFITEFSWLDLNTEEFLLCPPMISTGGDGAMFDIGFQNLSRLMASGKPLRVIVLDTQVYSNTGGQACTSGFFGQAADMSPYGAAQHGKIERRKELGLISIAHRSTYVLHSSQASSAHLLGGVLRGLTSRNPALFLLHSPCMPEHGIPDDGAYKAAKLALESRAFPHFIYDPDGGASLTDRLSLDGNPALDQTWPTYELEYVDAGGDKANKVLPLTTADWAATEVRFRKHFRAARAETPNLVPYHEFLELSADERQGKTPFIYSLGKDERLMKVICSSEMVTLGEDRLEHFNTLREMAGLEISEAVRDQVTDELEASFDERVAALKAEYEGKLAELKASYPQLVAGRIAEVLIGAGTDADLIGALKAGAPAAAAPPPAAAVAPTTAAAPAAPAADELVGEAAWIDQVLCTACDDCINTNSKIFAYDGGHKAHVANPKGGPFKDIVLAAERCPSRCIHPGDPQNPKERSLDKWTARAAAFR